LPELANRHFILTDEKGRHHNGMDGLLFWSSIRVHPNPSGIALLPPDHSVSYDLDGMITVHLPPF
jgi:hypothetical protein